MNFFKRYRDKKDAEALASLEEYKVNEESARTDIIKATEEMTTKPCPFVNMQNCFTGCIHFSKGYSFYMTEYGHFSGGWFRHYPKCKLWKD